MNILPISLYLRSDLETRMSPQPPIPRNLITNPLMRFLCNECRNLVNRSVTSSACSQCKASPLRVQESVRGQGSVDCVLLSLSHARGLGEEEFEAILERAHVRVRVALEFEGVGDDFDGPGCDFC
jgi:hypothetical protein